MRSRKRIKSCLIFAISGLFIFTAQIASADEARFDQDHAAWTKQLQTYTRNGAVEYSSWHSKGQNDLNHYLESLKKVSGAEYNTWKKQERLAYWINLYNAFTIRLVLNNYPIQSMRKIGSGGDYAWKKRFIDLDQLNGKQISLGEVENQIIRKQFDEPRIHFALNCAAKSCPVLRAEAYRAEALNRQLTEQTRRFVRNSQKNHYNASTNTLALSKIFKWYEPDFLTGTSSLTAFVAAYLTPEQKTAVLHGRPKVEFLPYDWALNDR